MAINNKKESDIMSQSSEMTHWGCGCASGAAFMDSPGHGAGYGGANGQGSELNEQILNTLSKLPTDYNTYFGGEASGNGDPHGCETGRGKACGSGRDDGLSAIGGYL